MSQNRLLFSASEDFLDAATSELRELFPDASFTTLGPDLGAISAEGLSISELAHVCRETPTIFVRHLARETGSIQRPDDSSLDEVVTRAVANWTALPLRPAVSLQVWSSGESTWPVRTDELRSALNEGLAEHGLTVARSGSEQVASAVLTADAILFGLNATENALSDWPGGRVRLSKPREQVSRSEFKLEELLREHPIGLPKGGIAIDLGASPGGWARILRQRGFEVWAVDPGDLHPRVANDPGVHHERTTTRPFLEQSDLVADVIVNDMRMDAGLSAALIVQAASRLRPGGTAIVTLKLTQVRPRKAVDHALGILRDAYEIVFARQLHHNRGEVTVVVRKPV